MSNTSAIVLANAAIYQRENLILSDVNFNVEKGEFVYVIGKVGSGKSSLIKTLNAEIELFEGTGSVAGFQLDKIKSKEIPLLRRKLGVVFQDFKLLADRSVYNNLLFVLKATGWDNKKAIEERIAEMLHLVGMEAVKNKMPHQLSGGEQQRIVIARALLNHPEIILADEPTGNLDHDTSLEIMELFKKIHEEGKTVLMATHDKLIVDQYKYPTYSCINGKLVKNSPDVLNFRDFVD